MSAQEGDGAAAEAGPSPSQDLYREKPASTAVRVVTVFAYLMSVSLAAILLSVYYICIWKSPVVDKASNEMYYRRGDFSDYGPVYTNDNSPFNFTGGSNTPVNQTAVPPVLDDFANVLNANETTETTINLIENTTLSTAPEDDTSTGIEDLNTTTVT